MNKKTTKRLISMLLSFMMAFSSLTTLPVKAMTDELGVYDLSMDISTRNDGVISILNHTLHTSFGMQGFEEDYELSEFVDEVEIIVQFRTPPAVALRLLQENGDYSLEYLQGDTFEEQALSAHETFQQQLRQIPVPFGDFSPVVLEEHYWLFNGVSMRVPTNMVAHIAELPEVFVVTPAVTYYPMESIGDDFEYFQATDVSSHAVDEAESSFFVNPAFMREVRDLLEIDYIHNVLGITGSGVRVAVLDTGIYHNHPEFERFRDSTGRVPGSHFWGDNSHATSHGTVVSGAVVAMAPGIELWHYRVALSGSTGGSALAGIEAAHRDGMDVMNLSFGSAGINSPFSANISAANLATLDGVVVVNSAGNSGPGDFTMTSPAGGSLIITVGNGTAGGRSWTQDNIATSSSRGPVAQTFHIKPDIVASGSSVYTTGVGGGYTTASGTSLSAPVVAGIAALLIEAFPNATPLEIKAMMMNTARSMTGTGNDNVFAVGAGFVRPVQALRQSNNAFATVSHMVPVAATANAPFEMHPMASLSFGRIQGAMSHSMPITIHNHGSGTWTPQVSFNGSHADVNLIVTPAGAGQFSAQMTFGQNAQIGLYQGNIVFTNGDQRITMPFAVMFDGGGGDIIWIYTEEDLIRLGTTWGGAFSQGRTFALANDIHLTQEWVPVNDFRGTLDGRGHAIHNLYILESSMVRNAGLFGSVGAFEITIRNLGVYIGIQGINARAPLSDSFGQQYVVSAGGLIARSETSTSSSPASRITITNSYVIGDISAIGSSSVRAGGLIGTLYSPARADISRSFTAGNVVAHGLGNHQNWVLAGGFGGRVANFTITDSFSASNVETYAAGRHTTISGAAGLVGRHHVGTTNISNSYVFGDIVSVTAQEYPSRAGAFAIGLGAGEGYSSSGGLTITNSYRLSSQNITAERIAVQGESLTAEQMRNQVSFVDWDFENIWEFREGYNNGFPVLRGLPALRTDTILWGDVNGDGAVNMLDLIVLELYLEGIISDINRNAADVNRDGLINMIDLILLELYLDGHITLPHIN